MFNNNFTTRVQKKGNIRTVFLILLDTKITVIKEREREFRTVHAVIEIVPGEHNVNARPCAARERLLVYHPQPFHFSRIMTSPSNGTIIAKRNSGDNRSFSAQVGAYVSATYDMKTK